MRNILPPQGLAGTGIINPTNSNFNELYQNPSSKIQRFISKARGFSTYKSDIIRVSIWADSIWNTYISEFKIMLESTFPNKTFEYIDSQLGGTGANYHAAMVWEVINFNPDLVVMAEMEDLRNQEIAETLIKKIKQLTSADILLNPFPIKGIDMDKLIAHDLSVETGYLGSFSYQYREWFYSIAGKYDCGIVDCDLQVIIDLWNGDVTKEELTTDGTHRLEYFFDTYVSVTMASFFQPLYLNGYLSAAKADWFKSIRLADEVNMPDLKEGVLSGTWLSNNIGSENIPVSFTYDTIQSTQAGAYYECTVNGIGFDIATFGDAIGQFDVLIDGVAPSILLKDYATSAHQTLIGLYKTIVDSNILSNDEEIRYFRVIMETATTYTLRDMTNAVDIRTGASITQDEVFTVTGGQLTIPANYAGITNWRGDLLERTPYEFYVKKNWYDTIDISADNLTTVTRIFGLDRGDHTVRLTVNSGTVNLDSIMELK